MPESPSGDVHPRLSRLVIACIGFVGHAPGIKLLTAVRFSPVFVRINSAAIAITLVAMGATYYATTSGWKLIIAWLIGHFIWSAILAGWVLSRDNWQTK